MVMARKNIPKIEDQGDLFDPGPPVPPTDLAAWHDHMKQLDSMADLEGIPHVDIRERRDSFLEALGSTAIVSRQAGLDKLTHKPVLARERRKRQAAYARGVFDNRVTPGAKRNRDEAKDRTEELMGRFMGDADAAMELAWSEFTPEERAQLVLGNPNEHPSNEEMAISFRGIFGSRKGRVAREDMKKLLTTGKRTKHRPRNRYGLTEKAAEEGRRESGRILDMLTGTKSD